MNDNLSERLRFLKRVIEREINHLRYSSDSVFASPFTEARAAKLGENEALAEKVEAYTSRFITEFISPFCKDRDNVRTLSDAGGFIEVHVDTPLEVCEQRDPKGLYQKAREGKTKDFTGIGRPYEVLVRHNFVLIPRIYNLPK